MMDHTGDLRGPVSAVLILESGLKKVKWSRC